MKGPPCFGPRGPGAEPPEQKSRFLIQKTTLFFIFHVSVPPFFAVSNEKRPRVKLGNVRYWHSVPVHWQWQWQWHSVGSATVAVPVALKIICMIRDYFNATPAT